MTLSRVVKELTAAGLASVHAVGRVRLLRMEGPPELVWERAKPVLRTPVRQSVWVAADSVRANMHGRLAGLSALARYPMLAEPNWPVYAMTGADRKAAIAGGIRETA